MYVIYCEGVEIERKIKKSPGSYTVAVFQAIAANLLLTNRNRVKVEMVSHFL